MNTEETRDAIIEAVKGAFKRLGPGNCKGKHYLLWIDTDDTTFGVLSDADSDGLTLGNKLEGELVFKGFDIASIVPHCGKPEGNPLKIEGKMDVDVYLKETKPIRRPKDDDNGGGRKGNDKSDSPQAIIRKARITLAPGSPGALEDPNGYVLEAEQAPYNIGRKIMPGDDINRVNHIVIIDEKKRVSRVQAHIGFSEKIGFFIQREEPSPTNRTKRIRKGDVMDLGSKNSKYDLKHGDVIDLSECVRLLFETQE